MALLTADDIATLAPFGDMDAYVRVKLTTTSGKTVFSTSVQPSQLPHWRKMSAEDGDTLVVDGVAWESYALGGYEIHYVTEDGLLCHACANAEQDQTMRADDKQWHIVSADIHYEGDSLVCDNCGAEIKPAYEPT